MDEQNNILAEFQELKMQTVLKVISIVKYSKNEFLKVGNNSKRG